MTELTQLIYTDLLELYMLDLENENKVLDLTVKAFQVTKSYPVVPSNPYPPQNPPWNPYPIWCSTETTVRPE
jgi:hypothetical protein